jgi:hypothetical protein
MRRREFIQLLGTLGGASAINPVDVRGTGLSDRDVDDISFPAFVRDFEAVVEAAKIRCFAVLLRELRKEWMRSVTGAFAPHNGDALFNLLFR